MFMRLFSLARRTCAVYFKTVAINFESCQLRCDRFDFIEDRVVEVDNFATRIADDVVVTRRLSLIHISEPTRRS